MSYLLYMYTYCIQYYNFTSVYITITIGIYNRNRIIGNLSIPAYSTGDPNTLSIKTLTLINAQGQMYSWTYYPSYFITYLFYII